MVFFPKNPCFTFSYSPHKVEAQIQAAWLDSTWFGSALWRELEIYMEVKR